MIFRPSSEERRDASSSRRVWKNPNCPAMKAITQISSIPQNSGVSGKRVNGRINGIVSAPNTPMTS